MGIESSCVPKVDIFSPIDLLAHSFDACGFEANIYVVYVYFADK